MLNRIKGLILVILFPSAIKMITTTIDLLNREVNYPTNFDSSTDRMMYLRVFVNTFTIYLSVL